MALDKSNIIEINEPNISPEESIELDKIFVVDNQGRTKITPKGLLGYYIKLIKDFFNDEDNENIVVRPFFQEDFIAENDLPNVLINRGTISPMLTSTPGDTFKHTEFVNLGEIEGVNPNETKVGGFLLSQQMQLRIYGPNRAELEVLAYQIYKLILATSDDVLSNFFTNVLRVNLPSMSSIQATPKNSDYYFIEIDWEIIFKECDILIFKEKLLKYTRLVVHDKEAKEIL